MPSGGVTIEGPPIASEPAPAEHAAPGGPLLTPTHAADAPGSPAPIAAAPARKRMPRWMRRIWVLLAGITLIIVGIIISPLPGPGFTVLGPAGLAVIATEFAWARRLLLYVQKHAITVKQHSDRLGRNTSRWWIAPAVIGFWAAVWLAAEYSPIPRLLVWAAAFPLFMPVVLWAWASLRYRGAPEPIPAQTDAGAPVETPETGSPG